MRCTQLVGLPADALQFIKDNRDVVTKKCEHCGHVEQSEKYPPREWKDASQCGMFDDGPTLMEYTLRDGSIVREEIQEVPWSSGPCIFLKLIDEAGNDMFTWPQDAIDNA